MPHLAIKTQEERNPESLLPPPTDNEPKLMHPNAARLDQTLGNIHPSKRVGYLETAYTRAIKGIGDDSENNYIPADQLAELISKWAPERDSKYKQIAYLEWLSQAEKSQLKQGDELSSARKNARDLVLGKMGEIKKMLELKRGEFF